MNKERSIKRVAHYPPNVEAFFQRGMELGFLTPREVSDLPEIDFSDLMSAFSRGTKDVQQLKNRYMDETVLWRHQHGLGPSMKHQIQIILQEPNGPERVAFGDLSTWIIDFISPDTFVNISTYLLFTGHTELWLGFAMPDDFVDPSGEKDTTPPLVVGIKNEDDLLDILKLIYGEITPDKVNQKLFQANNLEGKNLPNRLQEISDLINKQRLNKLCKRLARIEKADFDQLPHQEKVALLAKHHQQASELVSQLANDPDQHFLNLLNNWLVDQGQKPLNPLPDFVGKLFAQDNPLWQIGDMLIDTNSLTIEIPAHKYSSRNDLQAISNQIVKIKIVKRELDGKLFVFADEASLLWLSPLLNSQEFIAAMQKTIFPRLGASPYHQLQIMLEMADFTNPQEAVRQAKLSFLTDIISGVHIKHPDEKAPKILDLTEVVGRLQHSEGGNVQYLPPEYELLVLHRLPNLLKDIFTLLHNIRQQDGLTALKEELTIRDKKTGELTHEPSLAEAHTAMVNYATKYLQEITQLSPVLVLPRSITRVLKELTKGNSNPPLDNLAKSLIYLETIRDRYSLPT